MSCLFLFKAVASIDKLLTNNSMAAQRFADVLDVDFKDSPPMDILKAARDLVHLGHKLLTHPVTSGTAPQGSPYVSVIISAETEATDFDSVSIIESAIRLYDKMRIVMQLPEAIAKDFMLIDCEVLAKGGW